jgi:hypothetical protein
LVLDLVVVDQLLELMDELVGLLILDMEMILGQSLDNQHLDHLDIQHLLLLDVVVMMGILVVDQLGIQNRIERQGMLGLMDVLMDNLLDYFEDFDKKELLQLVMDNQMMDNQLRLVDQLDHVMVNHLNQLQVYHNCIHFEPKSLSRIRPIKRIITTTFAYCWLLR